MASVLVQERSTAIVIGRRKQNLEERKRQVGKSKTEALA